MKRNQSEDEFDALNTVPDEERAKALFPDTVVGQASNSRLIPECARQQV